MENLSHSYRRTIIIIVFIFIGLYLIMFFLFPITIKDVYVPNLVNGITTSISIIIGFGGAISGIVFRSYIEKGNLKVRKTYIYLVSFFLLSLVYPFGAYIFLTTNNFDLAIRYSFCGYLFALLSLFILLIFIGVIWDLEKEEKPERAESDKLKSERTKETEQNKTVKDKHIDEEEEKINKDEDDKLIEESRRALLQHFSSKSTLQATILLSLAIAFFAFIQTIPLVKNEWFHSLFYSLALTAFIFLTIHAFGRLIHWGQMAGLVERIKIMPKKNLKTVLEKQDGEEFVPTRLYGLESACNKYLGKSRVHHTFHKLTNEFKGSIAICLTLFVALLIYFLISNVIIIMIMACILAFLALEEYLSGIKIQIL